MPIDQLEKNFHECDMFLFTSYSPYQVNRSLIQFASEGQRNFDGWGIGYFFEQEGCVVRSSDPAADNLGQVSNEFRLAADIIKSQVVLGHLRRTSCGTTRVENNHPFKLHFLNNDWLFIHNGTATVRDLVPYNRRFLLESDSDSPRVFEFLKDQILEYILQTVNAPEYASKPPCQIVPVLADQGVYIASESSFYRVNQIYQPAGKIA